MDNQYEIAKKLFQSLIALKNQQTDLDDHYNNILTALKVDLPLNTQHYTSILIEVTKKLANQTSEYDEFYAHKIIQILQAIPQSLYITELQCSISILSSLVSLLSKTNQSYIPEIFALLLSIIENKNALQIGYPQLFVKTLHCLLQYNRGIIQEKALRFLEEVMIFIFENVNFSNQTNKFNLSTLQMDRNTQFEIQQKVNDEILTFCQLNALQPTPKLNTCYSKFITKIFGFERSGEFFFIATQIEIIRLYFRFNDGVNIELFSKLILKMNQHQSQRIFQELEENLDFELSRFHKYQNEVITTETISVIRKIKWLVYIIFDFRRKQENKVHYQQLCSKISKSLMQTIYYKWNQLVISVNAVTHTLNSNLQQSITNDSSMLDLESLPILNGEKKVLVEIESLLQSLQKHDLIFTEIFDKVSKQLDLLIHTVIVDESKIIKIQISTLLSIASRLFIINKSGCLIKNDTNSFINLLKKANLLLFNQTTSYNTIFQFQLMKFIQFQYIQIADEENLFLQVAYLDYLFCQNSQSMSLISDLSMLYIQQFDYQSHIASIIYRNISKIQESNLQVDQGNSLTCILHIYSKFDGYNQGLDTIFQVLKTIYSVFDKYYLKSEILFTQKYLEFLIMFFKNWNNPQMNNNLITILRQIILSLTQFFNHPSLHLLAFQCFYYVIPLISGQELKECTPKSLYGMNDDSNVVIGDTLGTIFYEQRKAFEFILLQDNQIDKLNVWMIINQLLSHNSCSGFFQLKSIQQFLKQFFKLEVEETTNAIKIYEAVLSLLILYYKKHESNPNLKELFQQVNPMLKKIQQIGSVKLQPLFIELNKMMSI